MIASKYTRVFVWPQSPGSKTILGFYALSPFYVERAELNNRNERKAKVPGIPVPTVLIGYMGKSQHAPPKFGRVLVADAAIRAASITDIGLWGICLHAENDGLTKWYEGLGFTAGKVHPRFMYAPFSALAELTAQISS
jgi:hypothetical protein